MRGEAKVVGGPTDGASVKVHAANPIEGDSFLNGGEYAAFRFAYSYATTQSRAIPGLAQISAEDAYFIYTALQRGAAHHQRQVNELLEELAERVKDMSRDELSALLATTLQDKEP